MSENRQRKAPHSAFRPGRSGNPGGRPKSNLSKTLSRILAAKFPGEKFTNEERLARAIVKSAIEGDNEMRQLIYDRLEGKAVQPIEGDFTSTKRIVLIFPEPEQKP